MYLLRRQVTTNCSGELPAHIGPSLDADDRFAKATARKAEAARYAAMSSSRVDTPAARGTPPSPARILTITSGAPCVPRDKDAALPQAASGDLNRSYSGSQHAQRGTSVMAAPSKPGHEGHQELHAGNYHRELHSAALPTQLPAGEPGSLQPDALQMPSRTGDLSRAEEELLSPDFVQQYGMPLPQQHAGSRNVANAHRVPAGDPRSASPMPSRVDSLQQWPQQNEAHQLSSSPHSKA